MQLIGRLNQWLYANGDGHLGVFGWRITRI
jgi:hypothetical protein